MAIASSLVRVFESTIQSASVMTDDMSHLDMLYAFKITSKLQEHMFEILVQMLSNELSSKPAMPTLHDPFRKSPHAFPNYQSTSRTSLNLGNKSHFNTLKRKQRKFNNVPQSSSIQSQRSINNIPVSYGDGSSSMSLLEESVLMNPINDQHPSTSHVANNTNNSLFDNTNVLQSNENCMGTENHESTKTEIVTEENSSANFSKSTNINENYQTFDETMRQNQATDNPNFNNSEPQTSSFFNPDGIELIEIKDEEHIMDDVSPDERIVDLNFSHHNDLKFSQVPGPSNLKSSPDDPSQMPGSSHRYFEACAATNEWQRKHCCFVCKKLVCKIGRHLELHSDVPEVQEAMSLPKKHIERLRKLTLMMYKGDYEYNLQKLEEGYANDIIVIHRIPGADVSQYVPCPACLGFMTKSRLQRHLRKNCPSMSHLDDNQDFY